MSDDGGDDRPRPLKPLSYASPSPANDRYNKQARALLISKVGEEMADELERTAELAPRASAIDVALLMADAYLRGKNSCKGKET